MKKERLYKIKEKENKKTSKTTQLNRREEPVS